MQSRTVILIEDEGTICQACRTILGEQGCTVTCCRNAREGREALAQRHFDLLLLDIMLPDVSGLDLLRSLNGTPAREHLAVIVMTGHATIASAVESMKLGSAEFLAKPFTADELIDAVNRVCPPAPDG